MSFWHTWAVGVALAAVGQITDAAAQIVPVMGYVAAKNANPKRLEIFKQGLTELGYVEGKNIRIEYREAVLDGEYRGVMTELVNQKVDVILAANVAATVAAAKATNVIPIVMMAVFDPVGIGVVRSLERPGTNVTGTTAYAPQLVGQRLRILRRLVANLDKALAFGARGLVNAVDTFINSRRFALAAAAEKYKLPVVYSDDEYVLAGGLMALGPGHYEGYYNAAQYVDKILRGANSTDLPITGPTQFTISVNRSTLDKLGLSLPPDLSAQVSAWID